MKRLLASAISFALALLPASTQQPTAAPDAHQVHWQRSLDDALAIAAASGKPLLIALNMDGESASDRIVRENYRDPAFVALTRHCVCLGASVFRHNARDRDDDGRRIPCPRFGEITCGEHVALEPILFAKYLADGERVAPRHALVRRDGSKAFDLALCFDLRDIDHALAAAVDGESLHPGIGSAGIAPPVAGTADSATWAALAARRDASGRAAFEAAVANAHGDAAVLLAASALVTHGDPGSIDAVAPLLARMPALGDAALTTLLQWGQRPDCTAAHAELLAEFLRQPGSWPGAPGLDARQQSLLPLLRARSDTAAPVLVLAHRALGLQWRQLPADDLGSPADPELAFAAAARNAGGPVRIDTVLGLAATLARAEPVLPRPGPAPAELPAAALLEQQLTELDAADKASRQDPAWCARFARSSLDLARHRLEAGGRDAQLLLVDAAAFFDKALAKEPARQEWWLDAARAAFLLQQFDREVECGLRALALATGDAALPSEHGDGTALRDHSAVEALRWIADGHARRFGAGTVADDPARLATLIAALRAFGLVAASPFGRDRDWVSFASFAASLGLHREALAIAIAGARRHPTSRELRQELNDALWRCQRPDLAPAVADGLAAEFPSADASWHAGYAWILAAEHARRIEQPRLAIAQYRTAMARIAAAAAQNPDYRDSCEQLSALAWLGTGMAATQDGDRHAAVTALGSAIQRQRDLGAVRDGLGCDVFDVVDRILEWRADGPSPVTATGLLAHLDQIDATTPFYAAAIADAALREALRADGRNPVRAERRTVDAAGKPVTMLMGLPNLEGDAYLLASIEAGRAAAARAQSRDDRLPLAQSLTIWAERALERGTTTGVREALTEAAPLLDLPAPAATAELAELTALTAQLRGLLGEARPRQRDGR